MSDPSDDEPQPTAQSGAASAVDPQKMRRARRRVNREEEERKEFWAAALSTAIGRRELWGILESGHAFAERFAAGPTGFPSPEATWCEAGEQRLAFRVYLSWLRLAPEKVALMLAENDPALRQAQLRT